MFAFIRQYSSFQTKISSLLKNGQLKSDSTQQHAISVLSNLSTSLTSQAWFSSPPKGVYIFGSVGSGKTMLMDMFYETVALKEKQRQHFNEFMLSFHSKMTKFPTIELVLNDLASTTKLLCLDEFQVTDIADAMILRRVLTGLSFHGITLVTTSNRHPDELYLNGIQRDSFLPCIEHMKYSMNVIHLSSESDYRITRSNNNRVQPNFNDICKNPRPMNLDLLGRTIHIPAGEPDVACQFSFAELLGSEHSAADFIAISQAFPVLFMTNLPTINDSMRNELRRLITLVDICYERKTKIYFDSPIIDDLKNVQKQLNTTFDESFALSRTISRLAEMSG